jgi:uncharacterized membrane protein YoaK (UPF0700 family)
MYRLNREDFVQPRLVSLWSLLAFQAGFLNAFGFLACGRYISHVTGFGTQIGVALAQHRPLFALELLGFPLFFIFGAFTAGLFTAAPIERAERPHFRRLMFLIPTLLVGLLLLGKAGKFGPFGEDLIGPRDFVLLFALTFVCGLQNASIAVLTKGQIRTTHLTGISTDIGTDFARLWQGKLSKTERVLTVQTQLSRIGTFLAFAVGSVVSVWVSQHFDYVALLVPLMTSLVAYAALWRIGRRLDHAVRRAKISEKLSPPSDLPGAMQKAL